MEVLDSGSGDGAVQLNAPTDAQLLGFADRAEAMGDDAALRALLDELLADRPSLNGLAKGRFEASLIALYVELVGPRVATSVTCTECDERFDIGFSVHDLPRSERGPHLDLGAPCAECGAVNELRFEPALFVVDALERRAKRLLREVHALAWTYHWSEREILEMSPRRRRQYLALIREEVERE